MTPIVIGMIALASVLHATWNVLLKTSGDPLLTSGRAMIAGSVAGAPFVALAWVLAPPPPIPPEAWVLGILSGVIEAAYLILLSAAYRRGDLSVVYPIARGSAALFAILSGVVLLGEQLGAGAIAGLIVLISGLVLVQRPWQLLRRRSGRRVETAILFALACGVSIASYSTIDRVGVRIVAPWVFAAILFPVTALGVSLWIRFVDRANRTAVVPTWSKATAGGILAVATYALVLAAYSIAPLSIVSPLRESAIVLVSGWGSFKLAEAVNRRDGLARVGGAALIVVGAVVLALGG